MPRRCPPARGLRRAEPECSRRVRRPELLDPGHGSRVVILAEAEPGTVASALAESWIPLPAEQNPRRLYAIDVRRVAEATAAGKRVAIAIA